MPKALEGQIEPESTETPDLPGKPAPLTDEQKAQMKAASEAAETLRNRANPPSAQSGMQTAPVRVVDFDEAVQAHANPQIGGVKFWFGEIGELKFADKTSYIVRKNRAVITDPKLVENLRAAAKNPSNKIFEEP